MERKKNVLDMFVDGAMKGWNMGVRSILPNVVMAFCIIQIMDVAGILKILATFFQPVMMIFGLPGEAVMANFAAMMSMGGSIGVVASLYEKGILNNTHVTILLPALFIGGGWVQYMGRILGTSGVPTRFWPIQIGITFLNAALVMFLMSFIA